MNSLVLRPRIATSRHRPDRLLCVLLALLMGLAPFLHGHPRTVAAALQGSGIHLPNDVGCFASADGSRQCKTIPVVKVAQLEAGCSGTLLAAALPCDPPRFAVVWQARAIFDPMPILLGQDRTGIGWNGSPRGPPHAVT